MDQTKQGGREWSPFWQSGMREWKPVVHTRRNAAYMWPSRDDLTPIPSEQRAKGSLVSFARFSRQPPFDGGMDAAFGISNTEHRRNHLSGDSRGSNLIDEINGVVFSRGNGNAHVRDLSKYSGDVKIMFRLSLTFGLSFRLSFSPEPSEIACSSNLTRLRWIFNSIDVP